MKLLKIWKENSKDYDTYITVEYPEINFWGFVTREKTITTYVGNSYFRDVETGEGSTSDTLENWAWLYDNNPAFRKKWDNN